MFCTLVLLIYLQHGQKQKTKWYFFEQKKTGEKQNSSTMIKPVEGIQTVFPVKLKLQRELCE